MEQSRGARKKEMEAAFEKEWDRFMEEEWDPVIARHNRYYEALKQVKIDKEKQRKKDNVAKAESDLEWGRINSQAEFLDKERDELRGLRKAICNRENEIERKQEAMQHEFEKEGAAGSD